MGFDDLGKDMQEKARTAETMEELKGLAKESGRELSDEELGTLSGGNYAPTKRRELRSHFFRLHEFRHMPNRNRYARKSLHGISFPLIVYDNSARTITSFCTQHGNTLNVG